MNILRKYGQAATILFPLVDRGLQDFDVSPPTFATGDVKIIKDEGAAANTTNLPAHEGNGIYSLALTATEMQAARIAITIIDTAPKSWEDQAVIIDTYGNASAEHAFDLDLATQDVNLVQVSGDAAAADNLEAEYDGTGHKSYLRRGIAQGGSANSITLDSGASATNNIYNGCWVAVVSGTGAGQARLITAYDGFTKIATTTINWITAPDATSVFVLLPAAPVDIGLWRGSTPNPLTTGQVSARVASMGANVLDAVALATDAAQEIADELLKRPISNVEPGAVFRTLYGAIASLVNRVKINASGNLEVYKTDDAALLTTLVATENSSQNPIVELDPP